MTEILTAIQDKIKTIPGINYTDENWGQIDYYSPAMPVKWPCCLMDLNDGQFSNIGRNSPLPFGEGPGVRLPIQRQNGSFSLRLTLADLKLSNTSGQAPKTQQNKAWKIYGLMEDLHKALHGFSPAPNCSKLLRRGFQKVMRDDGITEFQIIYEFEAQNV